MYTTGNSFFIFRISDAGSVIWARYVTDTSPAREIATAQENPVCSEMKPGTRMLFNDIKQIRITI